jgi:hypothetical protein
MHSPSLIYLPATIKLPQLLLYLVIPVTTFIITGWYTEPYSLTLFMIFIDVANSGTYLFGNNFLLLCRYRATNMSVETMAPATTKLYDDEENSGTTT